MIEHLHIKNFMCFKDLEIPTLKQVNLIAGKNNAGKTTLLDAVRILGENGGSDVINHILDNRNLFKGGENSTYNEMFNRTISIKHDIEINNLHICKVFWKDENSYCYQQWSKGDDESQQFLEPIIMAEDPYKHTVLIKFTSGFDTLNSLWEKVVLTDAENDVYEIIRDTIQPDLIRLDVGREIVRVRLQDTEKPVPLGTLGDGVYRILLIALSLANAQNSILLIDELELGLHYSALEKLWNMIFKYAKKWDIQVFATTHSQDVLRTFHYVADDAQYINDAQYIRLQVNRKGENEAIIFDGERLRESLELELEIR